MTFEDDELSRKQGEMIHDRQPQIDSDIESVRQENVEYLKTKEAQEREDTYADLMALGWSPSDVLCFLDAVKRGDIRNVIVGWML